MNSWYESYKGWGAGIFHSAKFHPIPPQFSKKKKKKSQHYHFRYCTLYRTTSNHYSVIISHVAVLHPPPPHHHQDIKFYESCCQHYWKRWWRKIYMYCSSYLSLTRWKHEMSDLRDNFSHTKFIGLTPNRTESEERAVLKKEWKTFIWCDHDNKQ